MFRFKKFSIDQSNCAMKINTDGVLLGAMVAHDDPRRILDIGTGTGVVALMLAQRYPNAVVDAVEIEPGAAATAGRNFEQASFVNRPAIFLTSFEDFSTPERYDLIVSNPPFFINDLKNASAEKTMARHAGERFFEDLLSRSAELLTEKGLFWVIAPVRQVELMRNLALRSGLYQQEMINISSYAGQEPIRQLICFSRKLQPFKSQDFVIYEAEKVHSEAYRHALKDFFLAF